jgi:two-component system, cell cycle sensor histidine kinase and response regulator CckA
MGKRSRNGDSGGRLSVNAVPLAVAAMSSRRLIKLIRAPWRERSADATPATPEETRSLVRRAFWIAGLALVGVAVTFGVLDTTRAQTERWVLHSREVSRLARQALTLAIDQETGIRGYLLTRDRRSLDPEVAARAQLARKLDSLVAMTADNRVQHRRALTAREAVELWQREFAAPALAQPDERLSRPALESGGLTDKALFDNVRSSFAMFLEAEDLVYKTRVRREGTQRLFAIRVVALEILVLIAVLLVLRTQLVDQTSAVLEQQEQLEEQAVELELQTTQLQEQAVELEERVQEAQAMAGQLEASNDELSRSMAEREGARASLAAERRFLRQIIDTMPHFVFAKDRQGRFTLVNQAVANAYGTTIEQLIGKTDADFNPNAAEVEAFRRADLAVMDSLTPQRIAEEPVTDASGAVRWVQTIKQPLVDAGGTSDQVLGVSTDITERKRLEVELLHSQKMDAVGQLAGGVAHDFNNMLTVITGYSAILLDVLDRADPNRADIEEIKGAADRAAGLTRQLLAFSRKQVLQPRVLDLNTEVITGLEKMLRRLIGEDVELVTTLDETLGLVNADPGQVEQVIMNLAVNARDAMPDGGRLVIETANVDLGAEHTGRHIGVKPGRYVMLAVSDTGRGMSRETMARIFEPFFTTKEKGKGTGLGLATVYGVVKQSGGDISVHSEPGQGTTFKVYLPRVQYETDVVLPASAPSRRAAGIETILLVEDDERLCVLSRRVLEARGYIVLEARNGQEALVLCDQHEGRIDLVATDVVMPGINGGMLVERLAVKRPALRVLFMSGYTDDDLLRRGIVDPRMAFLPKPFTPEALASKVREVLDGPGSVVAPSLPFPNASVPVSRK